MKRLALTTLAVAVAAGAYLAVPASNAVAQQEFITIGTGGITGVYYPTGPVVEAERPGQVERHGARPDVLSLWRHDRRQAGRPHPDRAALHRNRTRHRDDRRAPRRRRRRGDYRGQGVSGAMPRTPVTGSWTWSNRPMANHPHPSAAGYRRLPEGYGGVIDSNRENQGGTISS